MSTKNRITEFRITRNGTARQRSCAGGTVVGDYIDPLTGERVLTVKLAAPVPRAVTKRTPKQKPLPDDPLEVRQ